MNISQITRNAENQVASALRTKVERFEKSTKRETRLELLLAISNLAQDLVNITCMATDKTLLEKKPVPPMPPKNRPTLSGLSDEAEQVIDNGQFEQRATD